MHNTVAESTLLEQLEIDAAASGSHRCPPPNGWSLDQRFWTPDREVIEDGIVMQEKADEPRELPPCAAVHRGSIRPCCNWVRRHGWS